MARHARRLTSTRSTGGNRSTPGSAAPPGCFGVRPRSACSAVRAAASADPTSVVPACGSGSPAACPAAHTPASSTSPLGGRRSRRRSLLRRRLGVRALGEQLQERMCFSRDVQRQPGPFQLGLKLGVAATQPLELDLLGGPARLAGPGRQPLQRRRIALLAPLGDVRGGQALPAQQRATLGRASRQLVVLGEDRGLVLSREGAPPRPGGRIGSSTPPIIAGQHRRSRHGHQVYVIQSRPGAIIGYSRRLTSA